MLLELRLTSDGRDFLWSIALASASSCSELAYQICLIEDKTFFRAFDIEAEVAYELLILAVKGFAEQSLEFDAGKLPNQDLLGYVRAELYAQFQRRTPRRHFRLIEPMQH